jgi:MarR family transcriptional regulator for hemolysin
MEQDFARRLQATGITRGGYAVLSAIHYDKKETPAELASFLGVDGAAVTRHLNRIENLELIQRKPSATDRRSISICLTPQGVRAVLRGRDDSKATNKKYTEGLTVEDVENLQSSIRKMLANEDQAVADI